MSDYIKMSFMPLVQISSIRQLILGIYRFELVWFMVFNATFNNISVISWQSVLLVVPGENHQPAASHWQTLSHNVVSSIPGLSRIQTNNGTDCIGSYKSSYHTITTPKAPFVLGIYFIGTCMESIVYILTVECHLMYREQCLDNNWFSIV
jgi:hypothetical protein